jgi:ABC-type glycerol-3-phosphate transport system substrate-binding protein
MRGLGMRTTLGGIAAFALVGTLSACGGESAYCSAVSSAADNIDFTFTQLNQEQFDALQDRIADIETAAPDDVKGDWANLGEAYHELDTILADAGITVEDFVAMERGAVPEGLDPDTQAALADRLLTFTSTTDIQASSQAVRESAHQDCDVELGN